MIITFFGTRGSTPTSGGAYLRHGGNTTCVSIEAGETLLILDCGTGLLPLQQALFDTGRYSKADVFISHLHWDHIQGIAFFKPLFSPACSFRFYGEERYGSSLREQIESIMNPPMFPISADAFCANIQYEDFTCGQILQVGEVEVQTVRLNHPNICTGFRFSHRGKNVCFVCDYEHIGEPFPFADGADLLVYDAQYTSEEYQSKKGWGHSTWREGCALAQQCGASELVLTHHDPFRDDDELDELERQAQTCFARARFSYDGMRLEC